MVDGDAVDAEAGLLDEDMSALSLQFRDSWRSTHHTGPPRILEILLARAPDRLRLVQAEETVVDLARDGFGGHEVVEEPLLSQTRNIGIEDREGVLCEKVSVKLARAVEGRTHGSEVLWLVDGDEEVFDVETFEPEVTRTGLVAIGEPVLRRMRVVDDVRSL